MAFLVVVGVVVVFALGLGVQRAWRRSREEAESVRGYERTMDVLAEIASRPAGVRTRIGSSAPRPPSAVGAAEASQAEQPRPRIPIAKTGDEPALVIKDDGVGEVGWDGPAPLSVSGNGAWGPPPRRRARLVAVGGVGAVVVAAAAVGLLAVGHHTSSPGSVSRSTGTASSRSREASKKATSHRGASSGSQKPSKAKPTNASTKASKSSSSSTKTRRASRSGSKAALSKRSRTGKTSSKAASTQTAKVVQETPSAATIQVASSNFTLKIYAAQRCWIEYGPSAAGPYTWEGIVPAGGSLSIQAKGALWMRAGAALGLSFSVNGKPLHFTAPTSVYDLTFQSVGTSSSG